MNKPAEKPKTVRKLRCAIYTRKSSEEGLEQEFNSLHAQREACEAYIASQRSEGWVPVRDQYDDGGVSGGTLERPGLKRLLADIEDGLVDVVVVYKIDRLSRPLMDFSKLVEVFDRNGVTFVSVTQSFRGAASTTLGHSFGPVAFMASIIERLWRSLKYECVYPHAWESGSQAKAGIGHWMTFYNHRRPHSSLGGAPPAVFYRRIIEQTQPDQQVQKAA